MSSPIKKGIRVLSDEKELLIRETVVYGVVNHITILQTRLPQALIYILEREESIGWVDRVIMNYMIICARADDDKLDDIHYTAGGGVHFLPKLLLEIDKWPFPEAGSILCSTRQEFKEHIVSAYMTYNNKITQVAQLPLCRKIPNGTKLGFFVMPLYKQENRIPGLTLLIGSEETTAYQFAANPNLVACMFTDTHFLLSFYSKEMFDDLAVRLCHLHDITPLYFAKLQASFKSKLIAIKDKLTVDQVMTLTRIGFNLIEGFEVDELRKLSPGAWRLACIFNKWILGYYLGFDPRNGQVPLPCLKKALLRLSAVGPVSYAKEVLPSEWRHPFDLDTAGACSETDIMLNQICDYNPFDIVRYYENGFSWILTRPQFENILVTRTNPYSQEIIPDYALDEIRRRLDLVQKCGLPLSSSIVEILKSYESTTSSCVEEKSTSLGPRAPTFDQLISDPISAINGELAPRPLRQSVNYNYAAPDRFLDPVHEDFQNILNAAVFGMSAFSGTPLP